MKKTTKILFLFVFASTALVAQSTTGAKKPLPSDGKLDKAEQAIETIQNTTNTVNEVKSATTPAPTTTTAPAKDAKTAEATAPAATDAKATDATAPATDANGTTASPAVSAGTFVNSKAAFELVSNDDLSGVDYVEYKVNDGDYMKYTTPLTFQKEGVTTITYRTIDKVGNRENAQVRTITVDNTAPTVSLTPVEQIYVSGNSQFASLKNTYKINAEDKVAGIKEVWYSIDNEPKQKYTGQPIKIEKSGFHVITYSAIDNANNSSSDASYIINVDGIKPTVEIKESIPFVIIEGKTFAKKDTIFNITAKDGQSGVSKILVKVPGSTDFVPYVEPITISTPGEHTIEAKSIDNVGNESDVAKTTFFYDVKAPKTEIKAVSN